ALDRQGHPPATPQAQHGVLAVEPEVLDLEEAAVAQDDQLRARGQHVDDETDSPDERGNYRLGREDTKEVTSSQKLEPRVEITRRSADSLKHGLYTMPARPASREKCHTPGAGLQSAGW